MAPQKEQLVGLPVECMVPQQERHVGLVMICINSGAKEGATRVTGDDLYDGASDGATRRTGDDLQRWSDSRDW